MRILVVDKSRANRHVLARIFRMAGLQGHEFVDAENAKEALSLVESQNIDLIFSDWEMTPDMSGLDLLRTLNENGYVIPFGFLVESTIDIAKQVREEGATFFIIKPIIEEDIMKIMSIVT